MGTPASADLIGDILLFAGLTPPMRAKLAAIAAVEPLPAGATIFEEGDPAGDLYVVLDGRITLSVRIPGEPERSILSLREGELLGWSALLGRKRVATARVVLPSQVLRLRRSELLELCEMDHDIGYVIMRQAFEEMADRLLATRLQLLDVFGPRKR
ncbi:MAG: cyclic nucleotide-binding domain-containing protein [Sandaracinaceae bacterium]|nr:cyclic nucleotide-binding domain-containing protein [Sandaracinaceae bacterium]